MNNIEEILKGYGVLKRGHFLLTSGLHSEYYFEKFRILEHPELVTLFAKRIVEEFKDKEIDLVCGPTTGGIIIAFEVARQLGKRCIFSEKGDKGRVIRRGFKIREGERILVVDDVLTTGGSIQDTLKSLYPFKPEIVGVAVLIDRATQPVISMPYFSIYKRPIKNYSPEDCPLCKKGIPLETPGGKGQVQT